MVERWNGLVDVRRDLRLPVAVLVAALLWLGFFPQTIVKLVTPAFRPYLSADAKQ
jgi:NADH:ubiquinone oxidoreductase subunit 4 (subunit M)